MSPLAAPWIFTNEFAFIKRLLSLSRDCFPFFHVCLPPKNPWVGVRWENLTVRDDKTNERRIQTCVASTMTDGEELSLCQQACFIFELIHLNLPLHNKWCLIWQIYFMFLWVGVCDGWVTSRTRGTACSNSTWVYLSCLACVCLCVCVSFLFIMPILIYTRSTCDRLTSEDQSTVKNATTIMWLVTRCTLSLHPERSHQIKNTIGRDTVGRPHMTGKLIKTGIVRYIYLTYFYHDMLNYYYSI